MVLYLSFLMLFGYVNLYFVTTNYHHVNEVFNGFSHAYVYDALFVDPIYSEPLFDKNRVDYLVENYLKDNLHKYISYEYGIVYFYYGEISEENEISNEFTIQLRADLTFNKFYDKTFWFYIR